MKQRTWVPSRFIGWLAVSSVLAGIGLTASGAIQIGVAVLALLPLVAMTVSATRRQIPSIALASLLAASMLLLDNRTHVALWVILGSELLVLFLDAWVRSLRARLLSAAPVRPTLVRLERLNRETLVQASVVKIGDRIVVRPGEHCPVDGRVMSATATVFPLFAKKAARLVTGELVRAGSLAQSHLVIEALSSGSHTTSAALADIVERVGREIPPGLVRIEKLSFWAQIVWSGALLTWSILSGSRDMVALFSLFGIWWMVSVVGRSLWLFALAKNARRGLFIKTWEVLRRARHIRAVIFDKTGTITNGAPQIIQVKPVGKLSSEDILRIAGSLEQFVDHPIAYSIKRSISSAELEVPSATEIEVKPSLGVVGMIEGEYFSVGNAHLLEEWSLNLPGELQDLRKQQESQGATIIYVASKRAVFGALVIKDVARDAGRVLVADLLRLGLEQIQLLSGDSTPVVRSVAASIGIKPDSVFARMNREQKKEHVSHMAKTETLVVGDPQAEHAMLEVAGLGVGFMGWGSAITGHGTQAAIVSGDLTLVSALVRTTRRARVAGLLVPLGATAVSVGAAIVLASLLT